MGGHMYWLAGLILLLARGIEEGDPIVARVGQVEIRASEVDVSEDTVLKNLRMYRAAGIAVVDSAPDHERLEEMKWEQSNGRLASRIRDIVEQAAMARYRVVASPKEIGEEMERAGFSEPDSLIREAQGIYEALNEAVVDYFERGVSKDSAYARHLQGKMDRRTWEMHCITYEDSTWRAGLKRWGEIDWKDMDFTGAATDFINQQKLDSLVVELLKRESEEYRRYRESVGTGVSDSLYPLDFDVRMRERWWQQRFREADIEILDERYRGALDILFKASPREKE